MSFVLFVLFCATLTDKKINNSKTKSSKKEKTNKKIVFKNI